MLKRTILFFIISCLSISCLFSQTKLHKSINIQWNTHPIEIDSVLYPYFTDPVYEPAFGVLPLYQDIYTVDKENQTVSIVISNTVFLPISNEDLLKNNEHQLITDSLQLFQEVFHEKNRSGVIIKVLPYRKNPESGFLEQLYYAEIELIFSNDFSTTLQKSHTESYPEHSIFATGVWYKLEVATSGIYKITGSDLKNAGMDISSIHPKMLKLYGNGGQMIPEKNSQQKYLSLQENAIVVVGEEDNVFNESDYILFYGESPHTWQYDTASKKPKHQLNFYSNHNYYFIGTSDGYGKRIQTIDNNTLTETYTTNQSDYYFYHELELTNICNGGKIWLGENFNAITKKQSFPIHIPNIITSEPISITTGLSAGIATNNASSYFKFSVDGTVLQNIAISGPSSYSFFSAGYRTTSFSWNSPSSSFTLDISFSGTNNVNGWLDYFEIYARRSLHFSGGQMTFSDVKSIATNNITKFILNNFSSSVSVWNITDLTNITKVAVVQNGSNGWFKTPTDSMNFFIAFNGTNFYTPTILGKMAHQDLTGLRNIKSVIVTHPDFMDLAETLAQAHKKEQGLTTIVVTPQQIYNEFSSGKQDVGAIRDFMRMLYKTAQRGQEPEYLLFYGKGTYDYKNIKENNNNFIPIWTSSKVLYSGGLGENREYSTDDFFGFLDDDEGGFNISNSCIYGRMNIGIGRFPVQNRTEAEIALDKRLHYTSKHLSTKGPWQNMICFTADDGRENFPRYSEELADIFETLYPSMLIDKIYIDAYKKIHAAGGTRYPEAKNALTRRINDGTLIIDYVGHGGIRGFAEERIMEVSDAQNYTNYDHLTFLVTGTCSFTRFDDPVTVSAGEYNFLNANGSAIGLLTTIRETSAGGNKVMVSEFYKHLIADSAGNHQINTIGYACKKAKFKNSSFLNTQYFILVGDPTMYLAFPKEAVQKIEFNNIQLQSPNLQALDKTTILNTDTNTLPIISALSEITISGEIQDQQGNRIDDFNGIIYPKVFDKKARLQTLQNDPEYPLVTFDLWKNLIFSSKSFVSNGTFKFSFFVPKDIDYTMGNGRISFYAVDTITRKDATGTFEDFLVGGINPNADIDTLAPQMSLFMNDHRFVSGGITDENPILLVDLYDLHGINTTGSSVGHDLIAILDNNVNAKINLNSYYITKESYTTGSVAYQFYNLSEGEHTITVKAWDSYNNSVSKTINFTVIHSEEKAIGTLFNYPNPMANYTNFVFEHNQAGKTLDITIQIFDLAGRLVQQIHRSTVSNGYRTEPIFWDGRCNGHVLNNGVYIYRTRIVFPDGAILQKNNKLIIAR